MVSGTHSYQDDPERRGRGQTKQVESLAMKRRSPTRGRGVVVVKQFFAPAGFRLGGKDFLRVEMSVLGKKRGRKRGFGGMESN